MKDAAIEVLEVLVPLIENLAMTHKELTGEGLMEDDARYLQKAKDLLENNSPPHEKNN